MEYLKWQKEVLDSKAKHIVAQVCRRSGKTTVATDWAVQESKRRYGIHIGCSVAYIVNTEDQKRLVFGEIMAQCGSSVSAAFLSEGKVSFSWGGTIIILTKHQVGFNTRGQCFDAAVFDDAGYMEDKVYEEVLPRLMNRSDYRVLILTGRLSQGSIAYKVVNNVENVHTIQWDYLNMIEERIWTSEQARNLQQEISTEAFQKEFGPWTVRPGKTHKTNQDFSVLLRK